MTDMDDAMWLGRVRWITYALLVVATAVSTIAAPSLGDAAADVRITLAVAAVTMLWMVVTPHPGVVHYVGRTTLAFLLCLLNPLFAVFAFIGYVDAHDSLRGRWVHVGVAAVAVTQAGAQSGGLPPEDAGQAGLFVILLLINGGLASIFLRFALEYEETIHAMGRLNADLERTLAENAELHEQLVSRAHEDGVAQERQRLAREIHDTIAQSLAGVVTQLEAAVGGERQERALTLAREALREARRSVLDLAPEALEGTDLPAALEALVHGRQDEGEVRAEVTVTGSPVPLHPEVEATVLRVSQESLANVAKHARASRVGVTLSYGDDEVVLDVRDDGVGFDPEQPTAGSSFGLRGMRQRAERLAGVLTLESSPGDGTAVSLRLPALAREAA
ncbi:MAG TPA: sensor histidine kinase [Candidatus Janibacter merdipullorum]|nr:sensor histidine kinase [Candidatus Janibacter merdipullorum]